MPDSATFPLVSVCTPTRDRLGFLALLRRCLEAQSYPKSQIEWVVVDDGREPAEPVCAPFGNVKYIRLDAGEEAIPLGHKRNLSHEAACGDIFVYMDDDDYYPPCRIAHAVETLLATPSRLIAGAGILPVYFTDRKEIWTMGPYGPNHACAATFAFRRKLLEQTGFKDAARSAEERFFLKDYTLPMAQLESRQTILAMSHFRNTFDKRQLLTNRNRKWVKPTKWRIEQIIEDAELRAAYLDLCGDSL